MEQLTLFAEDFPVSPLVLPGSDAARQMTVISGRKCCGSLQSSGPAGLLARTLLGSCRWNSTRRFLIWKTRATPQKRLFFRLLPLTPHIDETDVLLFPTPTRSSSKAGGGGQKRKGDLRNEFMLIPTPLKSDASGHLYQISHGKAVPTTNGYVLMTEGSVSGQMNPVFVEWLMGFPTGWTELPRSETLSSRKSSRK